MKRQIKPTNSVPFRQPQYIRRLSLGIVPILIALALSAQADVVPPNQLVAGRTYGQWQTAFWQWALEIPNDIHHPLRDETGADALRGQTGPVWFLSGVMNASGVTTRDIVIPDGITLFISVIGVECSTLESPPFYGSNEAELRSCAESFPVSDLSLEVDGGPVPQLERFYGSSPLFDFNPPPNSLFGIPDGTPGQSVAAGVNVMLEPFSPGSHTLHSQGRISNDSYANVTYHITVLPRPVITMRALPGRNLAELSWPETSQLSLQESDQTGPLAAWKEASAVSTQLVSNLQTVTVTFTSTNRFFRLYHP